MAAAPPADQPAAAQQPPAAAAEPEGPPKGTGGKGGVPREWSGCTERVFSDLLQAKDHLCNSAWPYTLHDPLLDVLSHD